MNILLFTRFYLNGQTAHVLGLCHELIKLKHQPYLIISNLNHPVYRQWLHTHNIPCSPKTDPSFLHNLVDKHRFDIIHTHSAHTLMPALDLGHKYDIPVVATCHYLNFDPLHKLAEAAKIITISREMSQKLQLPVQKVVMIENGIDMSLVCRPTHKPHKPPRALILTRMTKAKEPGYIQLVKTLIAWGWQVKSIGNWRPNNLPISYSGWQIDCRQDIRQSDLIVGTGRSIREGMAAGCAALVLGDYFDGIVSKANVELLRHYNFSGRATKQPTNKQSFTSTLESLSNKQLTNLQNFGLKYAQKHFSQRKMAEDILKVYMSCK